jgi:hypothetical protein
MTHRHRKKEDDEKARQLLESKNRSKSIKWAALFNLNRSTKQIKFNRTRAEARNGTNNN